MDTPNLGHYQVAGKIFYHKISALYEASRSNLDPTWHFHEDVYGSIPWQADCPFILKDLYHARARQLRERYDYLVLSFSGGSDSWTALNSFVEQDLLVDEIFVRWPMSLVRGRYRPNTQNLHASNILSEWDYTIEPLLRDIQIKMPKAKIVISDWSDGLLTQEVVDDDWELIDDFMNPGYIPKVRAISDHEKKVLDSGRTSAVIFGVDKPLMVSNKGMLQVFFLDHLSNRRIPGPDNRHCELFFWSPELPEIVWCQARMIFDWLCQNPEHLALIDANQPWNHARKQIWDDLIRNIIYKDYVRMQMFQVHKPTQYVFNEMDQFMDQYKQARYYQSWHHGLTNVKNSISDRFLDFRDERWIGFRSFISPMYDLGQVLTV